MIQIYRTQTKQVTLIVQKRHCLKGGSSQIVDAHAHTCRYAETNNTSGQSVQMYYTQDVPVDQVLIDNRTDCYQAVNGSSFAVQCMIIMYSVELHHDRLVAHTFDNRDRTVLIDGLLFK